MRKRGKRMSRDSEGCTETTHEPGLIHNREGKQYPSNTTQWRPVGVCVCVYPGFAADSGLVLQEEVRHLEVAIVTSHMQRSVTHLLEYREKETERERGRKRDEEREEKSLLGQPAKLSFCYLPSCE